MRKRKLALASAIVVGVLAAAATAIGVAYGPQISTAASLRRMTSKSDGYNLYRIDIDYAYDLDAIIAADVRDDQAYIDAVLAQALPNIPVEVKAPKFACSAFRMQTTSGNVLMGRNYDFKDDTSALLVHTRPADGYESIGFAALNNLGANDADGSIKGRVASLLGPFATLDGINEKGSPSPCSRSTASRRIRTPGATPSTPRLRYALCSIVRPQHNKPSTCLNDTTCTPWRGATTTSS